MHDRISVKMRSEIAMRNLDELKPAHRNARTHSRNQLRQIAGSDLKILAATGHCPNLSAPAEVTAAIRAYV